MRSDDKLQQTVRSGSEGGSLRSSVSGEAFRTCCGSVPGASLPAVRSKLWRKSFGACKATHSRVAWAVRAIVRQAPEEGAPGGSDEASRPR